MLRLAVEAGLVVKIQRRQEVEARSPRCRMFAQRGLRTQERQVLEVPRNGLTSQKSDNFGQPPNCCCKVDDVGSVGQASK